MPCGLLSPDLSTRDQFSVLDERVAIHAGGRLGAASARRAWQSRHCAATLGVWVPRHPSRRGTLPRYSLNAARPTSGRTARRARLGRDGEAANSRRPGSAEPKHSSAFERHVQLDDAPVARGATVLGPGSQAEVRPDGSTGSAIEAGPVVRRHNARTGDWCSRPSCSRSCATDDS
jgi:hypothetical protein